MSREEVIQLLMTMQAAYPNYKVADKTVTVNLWHEMLKEYDGGTVFIALKSYIATDKSGFAPSVGAIIQGIPKAESKELNEMEAWALVGKALRDGYYHSKERFEELPELVKKAVGSPDNLRNWATTDNESIENVIQSNFIKTYRTLLKRKTEYDALPQSLRIATEEAKRRLIENGNDRRTDLPGIQVGEE